MSRDAQISNPRGVPEMEMNIVQKLLKGSAEIDRMRSEINQIVSLLIGYLSKIEGLPARKANFDRFGLRFNHGVETWIVGRIASDARERPFIELEISPWEGVRTVYNSEWTGAGKVHTLESAHVRGVHAALPRLVEGLANKFPELNKAWQPLLKAAEE